MFHRPLRLIVCVFVAAAAPVLMLNAAESGGDSTAVEHQIEVKVVPQPETDVPEQPVKYDRAEKTTPDQPTKVDVEVEQVKSDAKLAMADESGDKIAPEEAVDVPQPISPDSPNSEKAIKADNPAITPAGLLAAVDEDRAVEPEGGPDVVPQPMPVRDQKEDAEMITPSEKASSDTKEGPGLGELLTDSAMTPSVAPTPKEEAPLMTPADPVKTAAPPAIPQPAPPAAPVMEEHKEPAVDATGALKSDVYHNAEKGYSITFPTGWEIKEGFMGLDVFGLAPLKGADDRFRENVNVVTEDLRSPLTLDEYYDLGVKNLKMLLTDFKEIDSGKMDINGIPARWISYDHRMGEVKARVLQVILVKGDRAFIVTATASPEEYDAYKGTFDTIVKSFDFGAK